MPPALRTGFMLAALAIAVGCTERLPEPAEVLIVVDTDLAVPTDVDRLRVDVFADDGRWFDSRDVGLPSDNAWPTSFSVVGPIAEPQDMLVRVRAYRGDRLRSYRGLLNLPVRPPEAPPTDRTALCADPQPLPDRTTRRIRFAHEPFMTASACGQDPPHLAARGHRVMAVDIEEPGTYRFGVLGARGHRAPVDAWTVQLELWSACDGASSDPPPVLACGIEPLSTSNFVALPGPSPTVELDVELTAGRHYLAVIPVANPDPLVKDGALGEAPLLIDAPACDFGAGCSVVDVDVAYARLEHWRPDPWLVGPELDHPDKVTPTAEPEPANSVDRLVAIRTAADAPQTVSLVMRGACLGAEARLGDRPGEVDADAAWTCIDDGRLGALEAAPSVPTIDRTIEHEPSRAGTFRDWEPLPCPASSDDGRICILGGDFTLGTTGVLTGLPHDGIEASLLHNDDARYPSLETGPPRLIRLSTFAIDKYEVTLARWRQALEEGFAPTGEVHQIYFSFDTSGPFECSGLSDATLDDDTPMRCVTWADARAFCAFRGGDLPTEAQWEYVATGNGDDAPGATLFPWGDEPPACLCEPDDADCHAAVLDRTHAFSGAPALCHDVIVDAKQDRDVPAPVSDVELLYHDVSTHGVVGLVGNVAEWTRDGAAPYDACLADDGMRDPRCNEASTGLAVVRGASFATDRALAVPFGRSVHVTRADDVFNVDEDDPFWDLGYHRGAGAAYLGFRCVYPVEAP